ncbi:hypothetical protein BU23DRAFT_480127 [Bimuria novae-zelandiae CBS 107.79]|uniref:NF-kappa-B inhibitor-like protein 1 n=1 Tax=Bimuria novae-zelandiae CBS 107.79 TaxID=1447943 RepID=A0A6A5UVI1_9PLEO|nr:hypothetical protein BU23DRAFT_480127 [Bimuria novae-zelandiae CBS 107.79]
MEEPASDKDVYGKAKASRFQFKDKSHQRSKRARHGNDDDEDLDREERRSKRYRFDTDAMFRESIFDAMADDEGADYWEGVYGQPIHIYPNTKPGPDGKLERMTDEEYADFVRMKMWEKSHQHILEERAARERARQKRKEQNRRFKEDTAKEEEEREKTRRQMEESLHRGAGRRRAKEAEASWAKYLAKWDHLKRLQDPGPEDPREVIPWPVASGRASHVEPKTIEQFLRSSPSWRQDALALLKVERVRWHPDKMQQRFGQHIDTETMKLVTAVFQVVDRLWNERNVRPK